MLCSYYIFSISIATAIFGNNFVECYNELPSRQGLFVKVAQESWKLTYKRLVSELAPQSQSGAYIRPASQFSGPGISSKSMLAETKRYHIYLGNPCPWCHRVSLANTILQLSSHVTLSNLEDDPIIATKGGWTFSKSNPDPIFGANDLKAVYEICSPGYSGKVTAPLLVDKKMRKIVSNESKEIVRMLGSYKSSMDESSLTLCPKDLIPTVDQKNDWLYSNFNNAVYRAGFSTEQGPYDEAVKTVAAALESIERTLSKSKYINGDQVTESDVFLLPTVVRFDAVYSVLFKCTGKRIGDYEHIQRWVRDMYSIPGVPGTFDLQDAARSYYKQMFPLNPSRIVPLIYTPSYLQNPE